MNSSVVDNDPPDGLYRANARIESPVPFDCDRGNEKVRVAALAEKVVRKTAITSTQ
jgi:hypothetical protein